MRRDSEIFVDRISPALFNQPILAELGGGLLMGNMCSKICDPFLSGLLFSTPSRSDDVFVVFRVDNKIVNRTDARVPSPQAFDQRFAFSMDRVRFIIYQYLIFCRDRECIVL